MSKRKTIRALTRSLDEASDYATWRENEQYALTLTRGARISVRELRPRSRAREMSARASAHGESARREAAPPRRPSANSPRRIPANCGHQLLLQREDRETLNSETPLLAQKVIRPAISAAISPPISAAVSAASAPQSAV